MAQPVSGRYPAAHLLLFVAAIICFVVYLLAGFGEITVTHAAGWLGLGLALFAGSFL